MLPLEEWTVTQEILEDMTIPLEVLEQFRVPAEALDGPPTKDNLRVGKSHPRH